MKKILTTMAVAASIMVFSQLNYSVTGGYTMSKLNETVNGEAAQTFDAKHGYYAGIMAERKWGERIAFQAEAIFINLGGQQTISQGDLEYTQIFNFNRGHIPLSFRYYATYELAVYAGGYFNVRLFDSAKIKVNAEGVTQEQIEQAEKQLEEYIEENMSPLDYGIHFGSDFKIHKGLFIDARYSFGLKNLIENPPGDAKMTMNFLQVGLGYKF